MTLYVPPVKQHQRPVAVSSKPGVYSAIKLPYRNSTLSAVIILPDEAAFGVDVYAVMPQLHMEELLHNMSKLFKPVTPGFMLKLPKFDLRSAAMSLVKVCGNNGDDRQVVDLEEFFECPASNEPLFGS
jgi:hypothetical protein